MKGWNTSTLYTSFVTWFATPFSSKPMLSFFLFFSLMHLFVTLNLSCQVHPELSFGFTGAMPEKSGDISVFFPRNVSSSTTYASFSSLSDFHCSINLVSFYCFKTLNHTLSIILEESESMADYVVFLWLKYYFNIQLLLKSCMNSIKGGRGIFNMTILCSLLLHLHNFLSIKQSRKDCFLVP